jgi:hypothetical protein
MEPANIRATGLALPKPTGIHIMLPSALDAGHVDRRFNVCSDGFQSCFVSFLYSMSPFLFFHIYSVPLYVEVCDLPFYLHGLTSKKLP